MHQQQNGYQRIEVITGQRRHRQWSEEEKARIVAESFVPGVNISGVARRNGVSGGLLFKWRRVALEAPSLAAPLIPIMLVATEPGQNEAPAVACCPRSDKHRGAVAVHEGTIEIELAGARICVAGAVDKAALKTVLAALRETA